MSTFKVLFQLREKTIARVVSVPKEHDLDGIDFRLRKRRTFCRGLPQRRKYCCYRSFWNIDVHEKSLFKRKLLEVKMVL